MGQQIFSESVGSRIVHVIYSPNLKWYTAYCVDTFNQQYLNVSHTTEDKQEAIKYALDYLSAVVSRWDGSGLTTLSCIQSGQAFLFGGIKYIKSSPNSDPFTCIPCLNLSTGNADCISPRAKILPLKIREGQ